MKLLYLFYLTLLSMAVTGSREKRLVLHSETDVTQELVKLRTDFVNMQNELKALKDDIQHEHGSVYVRWGRTNCPQNGTTLIYKGYMAGKNYNEVGSGTNSVCLPEDPTWGKYQDGAQGNRAYIYGTEFDAPDDVVFGKHVKGEDIPCAVCQTPKVSIMIPARVDCYPGWKMEYTGYLTGGFNGQYGTEYVCLDGDPEFVTRGAAVTYGHLVYLVEGRCGALVCPPYFDYRELACVVCSL